MLISRYGKIKIRKEILSFGKCFLKFKIADIKEKADHSIRNVSEEVSRDSALFWQGS